jgi:hypothetical protein
MGNKENHEDKNKNNNNNHTENKEISLYLWGAEESGKST